MSSIGRMHNEYYDYDRYMGGADAPLVTVLRERTVRALKRYECACCARPIEQGERHTYVAFMDDEALPKPRFLAKRMHLYCPLEGDHETDFDPNGLSVV